MKQFIKIVFALGISLFSICSLGAIFTSSSGNNLTTFVGPTLRGGFTSTLNDWTAYSVAGEVGLKNFRVGGTLGWKLDGNQRFKVSAEYLWQDITYRFFTGNTDQWVDQGAVGFDYEYTLDDCCAFLGWLRPQFDLSAYYSHAPSKSLNAKSGFFTKNGLPDSFRNIRRIAGSNAAGGAPGISIQPWRGGKAGVELNYDNVNYDTHFIRNEYAHGFGGTILLSQMITDDIGLSVSGSWRQPFNNYTASLDWINVPYYGQWTLGLDAAYTTGKYTLPSTWNAGISANYYFDQRCPAYEVSRARATNLKGDYKGEAITRPVADDLLPWTAEPAVYMPQVLAIADQQ